MSNYSHTQSRVLQWIGIILVIGVFAGGYWYFQVQGSTLNQSHNDLVTNGLVGLWSMNGDDISGTTAYDRSGNGNNGTLTNSPAKATGKIGQGLDFFPNGSDTDAYVTVGDPGSGVLDFGSGDFTVGFWMKNNGYINQTPGSSINMALNKKAADTPGSAGYEFYYASNNKMVLVVGNGSTDYTITAPIATTGDNLWHYYIGMRSGSTVYLYIDSQLAGSIAVSGSTSNSNSFLYGSDGNAARNADAVIDEVRVYNRALAVTEIQALYDQGGGTKINIVGTNNNLQSGLAGYWRFDEGTGTSAVDSSVNGSTATLTNGPTWTTGQVDGAVTLDGSNDYISAGSSSALDFTVSTYTISAWIYPTAIPGLNQSLYHASIFDRWDHGCTGHGYQFGFTNSNLFNAPTELEVRASCGGSSTTNAHGASGVLVNNQWQHVVVVANAGIITFYVNGVSYAATGDLTDNTLTYGGPAIIGNGYLGTGSPYTGSIDEVRVYNRPLASNEVAQLYRYTAPGGLESGLKGYWTFDGSDISGTSVYDRSRNGSTGTLTNGPTTVLGRIGQAISFDGANDYIDTTTESNYDFERTQAFSGCAWINTSSTAATAQTIISKFDSAGWEFNLYYPAAGPSDRLHLYLINAFSGNTLSVYMTNSGIVAGQWYHACFTYDGSSTPSGVTFYLNGEVQATSTQYNSLSASILNNKTVTIGSRSSGTLPFTGKIDEVRIYNRALTGSEIRSLYDQGNADSMNSSASQNQGTGRLDSGLALYWALDDGTSGATPTSASDTSTNGITGTLTNSPTWTTGQIGNAVDFDGTDDYITVADTDVLDVADSINFTLSGWFNRDTFTTDDTIVAKSNGQASLDIGYNAYIDDSTDKVTFVANDGTDQYKLESVSTFTATGWHHYAVVWDDTGASQTKLYIDGVAESATTTGTFANMNSMANAVAFRVGAESDAGNPFDGKLDEIRMYRRALGGDEVARLYRLTTPTSVDTSLNGYWSFNGQDMSGTIVNDRSGSANFGTLTNSPVLALGKIGQGLKFDGTDDYVIINDSDSLDIGDTDAMTLTGWFNRRVETAAHLLVAKRNSQLSSSVGYRVGIESASDKINFEVSDGTDEYSLDSTSTFTTPGWHFFAVVWDPASAANTEIYVDGVADSATDTGTIANINDLSNTRPFVIGANSLGGGNFDGTLDEIRMYKRALTAAEIAALYNQGR